jgi:regulation of enolase protein 1 (concanavalin A-like superfamily)
VNAPVIVTVTVNDGNGNTNTCQATVTVEDKIPPVAVCKNHVIVFNGEDEIILNAADIWNQAASSDNCGPVFFVSATPPAISCDELGNVVPVTVTIEDASGNTATCMSMVTVEGLPCGWSQQPDGVNCVNGNQISYDVPSEIFTAVSTNCYYNNPFNSDELAFTQYDLCGDGSLTAHVTGISGNSLGWAGITMRESNAGGAKKVQLMINRNSNFSRREVRFMTNGSSYPQQFPAQNRFWLRLVRQGNQFVGYTSPNGTTWFQVMAATVSMNNCIEIGLIATNYQDNSVVTATFASVSVTGGNAAMALPADVAQLAPYSSAITPHSFEVYPNPTDGKLNVDLSQYKGSSVRMELYSVAGKLLQFTEIEEVQTILEQLDISNLQNGVYLVKVKSEGWFDITKRVVLARE